MRYKSCGKSNQVDYVMCRRRDLKEMYDCKVMANECVAKQHRMVVCKMTLMLKKKNAAKAKPKIRWWKPRLPDEWDKTAEMLRKIAETVLE